MNEICRICGEEENYHHEFKPMPVNCKCSHTFWTDMVYIPDPCDDYLGTEQHMCANCLHDEMCHE